MLTVAVVEHFNAVGQNHHNAVSRVGFRMGLIDFFRNEVIHSADVQSAAEFMSAPVGEESVAVFGEVTPAAAVGTGHAFGVELRPRRLTEPAVPVQAGGNRFFRKVTFTTRVAQSAVNLFDFANRAGQNNGSHVAVVFHNALRTGRANSVVHSRRFNNLTAFCQRQRQGLFRENVFTRLAGFNGNLGVPVVWRGDRNRVVNRVGKNVFVHLVRLAVVIVISVVNANFAAFGVSVVTVADRRQTEIVIAAETANVIVGAVSNTDKRQVDLFVWRYAAVLAQNASGNDHRRNRRCCCNSKKSASIKFSIGHSWFPVYF